MFSAFRKVAPNRGREAGGLDFEAFAAGQLFRHCPGITATQQDNIDEALATLNQTAVHYDDLYAARTEFSKPLFVSTLTLQRAIGMAWKTFGRGKRILGFHSIRLAAPVFGGDTVYARSRITEIRQADDPSCGQVTAEITVARDDGTDVACVIVDMLIHRADAVGRACTGGFASRRTIAPGRLIETIGIEFDALRDGLVIEHTPPFTFSWEEARRRLLIAGDHGGCTIDGFRDGHGARVMLEAWVVPVVAAATTRAFGRVVANLAWEDVVFEQPARHGDRITVEAMVLSHKESRSRPDQGILRVSTRAVRQDHTEVCRFERTLLVYRSAAGPHREAGYVRQPVWKRCYAGDSMRLSFAPMLTTQRSLRFGARTATLDGA